MSGGRASSARPLRCFRSSDGKAVVLKWMMIIAGAGLTLFSGIAMAEAKDCKPLYTAEGPLTQPSQWDAERSAKHYWKGHVAKLYGSKYADWDKAEFEEDRVPRNRRVFSVLGRGRALPLGRCGASVYQAFTRSAPEPPAVWRNVFPSARHTRTKGLHGLA